MGGRDILIEKIKQFFRRLFNQTEEGDSSNKKRYIVGIGLIGLIFIVFSNLFSTSNNKEENIQLAIEEERNEKEQIDDREELIRTVEKIEKRYEDELESMLKNIQGIDDVDVMVNLSSTNVKVYEKNKSTAKQYTEELDQNGGERVVEDETEESEIVFVRQGDHEVPLLIQTNKSYMRVILSIAAGAANAEMKQSIVQSNSRVLDVPVHRISVMPKVRGDH